MSTHPPALYIFDMGGVVTVSKGCPEMRVAAGDDDDQALLLDAAGEHLLPFETGVIGTREFLRRVGEKLGREVGEDVLTRCFRPEPDRDVLALVEHLKERARVVVGTNTIAPHYAIHVQNGDYDAFHAVYASHLIGLAKPDPAFFRHILSAEDRRPEETVFVDDTDINVVAARAVGLHAFLFSDAQRLERDLRRIE